MADRPKQRDGLLNQWLPYVPPAVRLNVRISPRQCIYVFREIPNEHFIPYAGLSCWSLLLRSVLSVRLGLTFFVNTVFFPGN